MRIAVITLRYSPTLGAFDTAPLTGFTKDRSLLSVNEHFFRVDGVPHLACVIRYQEATVPRAAVAPGNGASGASGAHRRHDRHDNRPDPLEGLSEEERVLFHSFRESSAPAPKACRTTWSSPTSRSRS